MEKRFYVYRWTNTLNGKAYIGKGTRNRAKTHLMPSGTSYGSLFASVVKRVGKENFSLEFLAQHLTHEAALEIERYFIAACGTRVPKGYNLTDGGEGRAGYKLSQETKDLIAAGRRGKLHTLETKAKMSSRHFSQETRQRMSDAGKKKEPKRKFSLAEEKSAMFLSRLGASGRDLAKWFGVSLPTIQRAKRKHKCSSFLPQ